MSLNKKYTLGLPTAPQEGQRFRMTADGTMLALDWSPSAYNRTGNKFNFLHLPAQGSDRYFTPALLSPLLIPKKESWFPKSYSLAVTEPREHRFPETSFPEHTKGQPKPLLSLGWKAQFNRRWEMRLMSSLFFRLWCDPFGRQPRKSSKTGRKSEFLSANFPAPRSELLGFSQVRKGCRERAGWL